VACYRVSFTFLLWLLSKLKLKKGKTVPTHVKKALMGGGGIGLPMLHPFVKRGWVVNVRPWSLDPRQRYMVPILQEVGCASAPVWTGLENFTHIRFRIPKLPACSRLIIDYAINLKLYAVYITEKVDDKIKANEYAHLEAK
jgi:hypothetical protein